MSRIEEVLRRASREAIDASAAVPEAQPEATAPAGNGQDDPADVWRFEDVAGSEPEDARVPEVVASVTAVAPTWVPSELPASAPAAPDVQVQAPDQPTGADVLITRTLRLDAIEQYRKLAASLHEAQTERGIRSVLCTSALMGEGKTVTACNLALTLSESYGRRVLLIDADLRRPQVHAMFGIPNDVGLREALAAQDETKLRLQQVTERLSVLVAGSTAFDPMSGLVSDRLRQVISEATIRFDWVVVDTPPVLMLPDARVLVSTVDAVLLVVRAGVTTFRTVKRAVDVIKKERIFGAILNSVEEGAFGSDYAGYDRYYAAVRSA